ncbi:hypothetical protein KMY75_06505, partial [Klebsiella quasipneumoniae]|nr:hypothetical protein [Klebsiella quasipneumoniae]
FVVGGPVGDSELLLCHGMVCVVGRMRDLILQLSKSSIYSTKPYTEPLLPRLLLKSSLPMAITSAAPSPRSSA